MCGRNVADRDGKSDPGGVVFDPVSGVTATGRKSDLSARCRRVDRSAVHMGSGGGNCGRKTVWDCRHSLFYSILLCAVCTVSGFYKRAVEKEKHKADRKQITKKTLEKEEFFLKSFFKGGTI